MGRVGGQAQIGCRRNGQAPEGGVEHNDLGATERWCGAGHVGRHTCRLAGRRAWRISPCHRWTRRRERARRSSARI